MSLREDHAPLPDAMATRRYFAKFDRIIGHLRDVHAVSPLSGTQDAKPYLDVIEARLADLSGTFRALSFKHLVARHVSGALPHELEIDRRDSGFPVYRELLQMANDKAEASRHLDTLPAADKLKQEMVDHILRTRTPPRRLQFALSQRLYYGLLAQGPLFLAQNHPQVVALPSVVKGMRRCLVHWAVYDSRENYPVLYFLEMDDSGSVPLIRDDTRWPAVQGHLLAQSMNGLKLVTIGTGFDSDFEDLHPKLLTRIHVGPMYSDFFTEQDGPLREVLAEAAGDPGLDWTLCWTVESLVSRRVERKPSGVFSSVQREIFDLDTFSPEGQEAGATRVERALIMPQAPYQVLADRDPPGLRSVRKYVVGSGGRVLAHM
ncbi:MAG: hypothetical protein VYB54_14740 [Pseudomonadota bacterium]|nr:hypothetical protein [Pseudomonadota bacterium]